MQHRFFMPPVIRKVIDTVNMPDKSLNALLSLQQHLDSLESAIGVAAGPRSYLGQLLLQANRITEAHLQVLLDEQKQSARPLGEILIERAILTPAELNALLGFQMRQSMQGSDSPLQLGQLLVRTGEISEQQLQAALALQSQTGKRLGEVLVEAGYAEPAQIEKVLGVQRKFISVALSALLLFAALPQSSDAQAGQTSASLTVSVTVLPHVKMDVQNQAMELKISQKDIQRGYIDVPAGSRFSVHTNSREGFILDFHVLADLFQSVQIRGLDSNVNFGIDGGAVTQRLAGQKQSQLELGYRFYLASDMQPGLYPWPLMVSARVL
ncbi:MAG: hypothetical protein PHH47_02790 [Gallionella sp.]|nr:hypothetical protein [Gallionella sp.]MDD4945805.1 hypothetical protein [Gallionella sp.]